MKTKDILKLKNGDNILHVRYGKSKVKEVILSMGELFGVVITPITDDGKKTLRYDSQTDIPDFLEGSIRQLKQDNTKMSRVKNDLLSVYKKETGKDDIHNANTNAGYVSWLNERINETLDILVLLSIDTEKYIRRVTNSEEEAKKYFESSGISKLNEGILMLSGMTIDQIKEQ